MKLTSEDAIRIKPNENSAAALNHTAIRSITDGDCLVVTFRHADGRRARLLQNYHFA